MTKEKITQHPWIVAAKKRGWDGTAHFVLDVIEPFASLTAQLLWVVQPVSTIFGARQSLGDLARILDSPDGIDTLREQLNQNHTDVPS